jgi:uncharacterized integral membrane protein
MHSETRTPPPPPSPATGTDSTVGPGIAQPELGNGDAPAVPERAADRVAPGGESARGRSRRMARRTRLHGYAVAAVALVAVVIALAVSNTAHVKVSWIFGTSHVSLVWLVLFAAILGWLLGLATNAALHRRTRAPRPGRTRT